jgi:hypothetical protein
MWPWKKHFLQFAVFKQPENLVIFCEGSDILYFDMQVAHLDLVGIKIDCQNPVYLVMQIELVFW